MTQPPMHDNNELYVVMDLETNGRLLSDKGRILEVAAVVTTTSFDVLHQTDGVVTKRDSNEDDFVGMPEVVYQMHTENGLLQEIADKAKRGSLVSINNLDWQVANMIEDTRVLYKHKSVWNELPDVILSGSGVSHFDSRWIKHFMPHTWGMLKGYDVETKPTVDIGVVRRFLQKSTMIDYEGYSDSFPVGNHRALGDCMAFIAEARWIRNYLNQGCAMVEASKASLLAHKEREEEYKREASDDL